jgi:hypothetical protein
MKTFNESQMGDPWAWCRDMLDKHSISSKMLSDLLTAPRSTVRSLYNGSNASPRYELLRSIINLCIALENGERPYRDVKVVEKKEKVRVVPTKVALEQPEIEYDFL